MKLTHLGTSELLERLRNLTSEMEMLDAMREEVYAELERRDTEEELLYTPGHS